MKIKSVYWNILSSFKWNKLYALLFMQILVQIDKKITQNTIDRSILGSIF